MLQDSCSRRAFPLDSRAVWVESQISKHGFVVPRDNLPVGPGEYNIKLPDERHISTPSLGRYKGPADHFRPFKSNLSVRTPHSSEKSVHFDSLDDSMSMKSNLSKTIFDDSVTKKKTMLHIPKNDFKTRFHNHDERMAYDPNKRFTDTPGCYYPTATASEFVKYDGFSKVKTANFGPKVHNESHRDRNKVKQAGPEYNIKYDSLHIKPKEKYGAFSKSNRGILPENGSNSQVLNDDATPAIDAESSLLSDSYPNTFYSGKGLSKISNHEHTASYKATLVRLPILKKRIPPTLTFDRKSYHYTRNYHDLTPSYIHKEAKIDFFGDIVKIPRKHKSVKAFGR